MTQANKLASIRQHTDAIASVAPICEKYFYKVITDYDNKIYIHFKNIKHLYIFKIFIPIFL